MKLLTSKKAIITILSTGSIVLAGTIKDFQTRAIKLETSAKNASVLIPIERNVASETNSKVAQIFLLNNLENSNKINSKWEITRIIGSDEKVTYDKFSNVDDSKKTIQVKFELVGTSLVRLNDDKQLEYRISLLSDFGTIALFKKMGNGYEILEAKKIATPLVSMSLIVTEDVELVLERALNQAKSNKVLDSNNVSGSVTLSSKAISDLSVSLTNPNGETQNIEIDHAILMDGGTFNAEVNGEEISGVVLNNGKDGYRISFVTGPIAGSMLNFITKEEIEKLQEIANDSAAEADLSNPETAEVQQAADKLIEERKEVASDTENYQPVNILTADEIKETAEENGFAF